MTLSKSAGIAAFLMPITWIAPFLIYLSGDLRSSLGPVAYGVADVLYGPLWAICIVLLFRALQTHIGGSASQRMSLAMSTTWLAVLAMVCVACIRSANRQYHLAHPELRLEDSVVVLTVWSTLISGISGAGWHFLGWSFVLLAWAGWTTRRLPQLISLLCLATGITALLVYVSPEFEGGAMLFGIASSIGLGLHLWRAELRSNQTPAPIAAVA